MIKTKFLKDLSLYKGVLITGGSSGIGYSILNQLLTVFPNLWVGNISRRKPDGFSSKIRHFECDLSKPGKERENLFLNALTEMEKAVPEGKILIINNSGFGDYGAFCGEKEELHLRMMEVNVMSPIILTSKADSLLRKRGGAVVNVASTAAFQPTPFMAVYGSGKAFLMNWSLALSQDYKGTGVHVIAVCPGPTETEFFKAAGFTNSPTKGFGQSSDQVARTILIALARKRTLVISGWGNRLLTILIAPLSKSWAAFLAGKVLGAVRLKSN